MLTSGGCRRSRGGALLALALVGAVGLTGCSDDGEECGDTVYARVAPGVDFDAFETFAIAEVEDIVGQGGAGGESAIDIPSDIRTDLDIASAEAARQLELMGLTEVSPDAEPDLLVATAAASSDEAGVVWECVPGWYWWGWQAVWDSCAWVEPIPVTYSVGTLVVALVEASSNEVVFGGFGQGLLECGDGEDRIVAVVDDIFDSYPLPGN